MRKAVKSVSEMKRVVTLEFTGQDGVPEQVTEKFLVADVTSPLLAIGKLKRNGWGIVRNAVDGDVSKPFLSDGETFVPVCVSKNSLSAQAKIVPGHPAKSLLLQVGHTYAAAAVLLIFVAYRRPGEALGLREGDLVKPSMVHPHFTLNLHPEERQETSESGLRNETVMLDSVTVPFLGNRLNAQARVARSLPC